jgi:putative transposase
MDSLRVKIRAEHHIENRSIHVAIGVNLEGTKEVRGFWVDDNEGAKFRLHVLTEIQNAV